METITNFTNFSKDTDAKVFYPQNLDSLKRGLKNNHTLIGNLKSYGDCCVGNKNYISLKNFNKVVHFDKKGGLIEVQSGMKLRELMKITLKEKMVLRCMPGSKYVSIGGMVATNIQGKCSNFNNFKHYIKELTILRNNKLIKCSPTKNNKLFNLTVGGFGLTGPIISIKLKLKKIESNNLLQQSVSFKSFSDFKKKSRKKHIHEYTVVWIDFCKNNFSGLFFFGDHKNIQRDIKYANNYKFPNFMIFFISLFASTKIFIKLFNKIFYLKNLLFGIKMINIYDFSFPQDVIRNFNYFFGKKGFLQFQISLHIKDLEKLYVEIKNKLIEKNITSTFCIIKFLDDNKQKNSISLSLDIPVKNNLLEITSILNSLTNKHKLNVNLSKDLVTKNLNRNIINSNQIFKKKANNMIFKKHTSKLIQRIQNTQ